MFVVEKGPNQNDPNYANYLYKTDLRKIIGEIQNG